MKIKGLLLGMLACAAMVACTNDDIVENNVDNGVQGEGQTFVTVRLAFPQTGVSRAAEDFDDGLPVEFDVENVYFAFYSANGTFLGYDEKSSSDLQWANDASNNVTKKATITLNSKENPASVVAIVNSPASLKGRSLSGLATAVAMDKDAFASITTAEDGKSTGKFVMLNSTYVDGNNLVVKATNIPDDYMAASETEAENNNKVLDIYVERLAAKVTVTEANDIVTPTMTGIEGLKDYTFEIVGWGLNGTNKSVYPLKAISTSYSAFTNVTWNSPTNFRSYWAEDPNYAGGEYISDADITQSEDEGEYEAPAKASLNYISWSNATNQSGDNDYCLENTMEEGLLGTGKNIAYTHLLVAAQVKKENAANDIYKYKSVFYDETGLKSLILNTIQNRWGYRKLVDSEYKALEATDLEVKTTKEVASIKVKAEVALFKIESGKTWDNITASDVASVTDAERTAMESYYGTATYFNGGRFYYYIPIKHFAELQDTDAAGAVTDMFKFGAIGVVRNHWYNLKITKIMGIGNPVYDPNAPIVPKDEETKEWFFQASLNILAWNKMPEQEVEF